MLHFYTSWKSQETSGINERYFFSNSQSKWQLLMYNLMEMYLTRYRPVLLIYTPLKTKNLIVSNVFRGNRYATRGCNVLNLLCDI